MGPSYKPQAGCLTPDGNRPSAIACQRMRRIRCGASVSVSDVFNDGQSLEPSTKYTAHWSTGLPPGPRAHCMKGLALRFFMSRTARGLGDNVFSRVA